MHKLMTIVASGSATADTPSFCSITINTKIQSGLLTLKRIILEYNLYSIAFPGTT